jgi:xanthine dehydrogenase accessory factor
LDGAQSGVILPFVREADHRLSRSLRAMLFKRYPVLIRGAGEHASAIAWQLHAAGFPAALTELPEPLAIRRQVSFSMATRQGEWTVEGVTARLCHEPLRLDSQGAPGDAPAPAIDAKVVRKVKKAWREGELALVIDGGLALTEHIDFFAIVDARMQKTASEAVKGQTPFTLAIGPGITAGEHVDVVIETERGHNLGRILRKGRASHDTKVPGEIAGETVNRVYHAPCTGRFWAHVGIGDLVGKGDLLGVFEGNECDTPCTLTTRIAGRVRGLLADGASVPAGTKVADIDPRGEIIDPATISEKSRCIAGGVLTALLAAVSEQKNGRS